MNALALAAYLTLCGADAATTHIGLSMPGSRELVLSQSPLVNDGLIGVSSWAVWRVTRDVKNPWLKWSARFAIGSIHGVMAVHNIREIRK